MRSILRWLLGPTSPERLAAIEDQKHASYAYCREGHMNCVALCECRDTWSSRRAFLRARTQVHLTGQEPSEESRTRGNIGTPWGPR